MPMKQIAFRVPEDLEKKIPKPSLGGDRTKFLRNLIEWNISLEKAMQLYNVDRPKSHATKVTDQDLVQIKEATPSLTPLIEELQYLRDEQHS